MRLIDALAERAKGKTIRFNKYDFGPDDTVDSRQSALNEEGWSVVDPPEPPKARTRIAPVTISYGFYVFDSHQDNKLEKIFSIPHWTGRVEVKFADGSKRLFAFEDAFAVAMVDGVKYSLNNNAEIPEDFIPAIISGVEFWSE